MEKSLIERIKQNNEIIKLLQQPMYDPNLISGQRYVYYDKTHDNFLVKIKRSQTETIAKRFKRSKDALKFRDETVFNSIKELEAENKKLKKQIDEQEQLEHAAKNYSTLLKNLQNKDMTSAIAKSGQKYIHYDKHSDSGMYGVRIYTAKKEKIVDARFPNLREAISYRDNVIPQIIDELKNRLDKIKDALYK